MPRGGFGGRGFGGRGFGMRRFGAPLMPMGMGMGMGSPLLTTLLAGGVGYALGSSSAQQAPPQAQQAPPYQPYPYQAPPAPPQQQVPAADTGRLAQLKLLGELRESGILTDDEFEREKQRILRGS
jgi:putative oligomerization/nucleic acid binding protein